MNENITNMPNGVSKPKSQDGNERDKNDKSNKINEKTIKNMTKVLTQLTSKIKDLNLNIEDFDLNQPVEKIVKGKEDIQKRYSTLKEELSQIKKTFGKKSNEYKVYRDKMQREMTSARKELEETTKNANKDLIRQMLKNETKKNTVSYLDNGFAKGNNLAKKSNAYYSDLEKLKSDALDTYGADFEKNKDYQKALKNLNDSYIGEFKDAWKEDFKENHKYLDMISEGIKDTFKNNKDSLKGLMGPVNLLLQPMTDFFGGFGTAFKVIGGGIKGLFGKSKKKNPTPSDVLKSGPNGVGALFIANKLDKLNGGTNAVDEGGFFDKIKGIFSNNQKNNPLMIEDDSNKDKKKGFFSKIKDKLNASMTRTSPNEIPSKPKEIPKGDSEGVGGKIKGLFSKGPKIFGRFNKKNPNASDVTRAGVFGVGSLYIVSEIKKIMKGLGGGDGKGGGIFGMLKDKLFGMLGGAGGIKGLLAGAKTAVIGLFKKFLANFGPIAIVTSIIMMVIDGIKGVFKSKDWGTSKVSGFIGGFLGGAGNGGIKDAFKNMGKWALLGAGIGSFIVPPIGTIVGGLIGAVIGAILGFIGGKKIAGAFDKMGKWFKDTCFPAIGNFFKKIGEWFLGVFKGIGEFFKNAWNKMKNAFGNMGKAMVKGWNKVTGGIKAVKKWQDNNRKMLAKGMANFGKAMGNFVSKSWEATKNGFSKAGQVLGNLGKSAKNNIGKFGNWFKKNVFGKLGDMFNGIKDFVGKLFSFNIVDLFKSIKSGEFFKKATEFTKKILFAPFNFINKLSKGKFGNLIGGAVKKVTSSKIFKNTIGKFGGKIIGGLGNALNKVKDNIGNAWNKMKEMGGNVVNAIKGSKVSEFVTNIFDNMKKGISKFFTENPIGNWLKKSIVDPITNAFSTIGDFFQYIFDSWSWSDPLGSLNRIFTAFKVDKKTGMSKFETWRANKYQDMGEDAPAPIEFEEEVGDAIIRPDGSTIKTDPKDTLVALKNIPLSVNQVREEATNNLNSSLGSSDNKEISQKLSTIVDILNQLLNKEVQVNLPPQTRGDLDILMNGGMI